MPTTNRFAALQNDGGGTAMDTGEQQQQTTTNKKKSTVSPIIVTDHDTDIQAILKELNLESCHLKINSVGRKILPNTPEEKEKIIKHLKEKNKYFYTHPDSSEKVFKVVLSGLPQVEINDIVADLTAQKVTPSKVTMFNTQSKNKLYLVHFDAEQVNKKTLESIKYVYHHVIRWQPYKPKRNGPTQCLRCLWYGHGLRSCNRYAACMLCAGQHLTSACTVHKKGETNNNAIFTCFNCKSANQPHNHKANDINCPFREKYELARNNARTKTTSNHRTQANTTRYVQAPPPPPLHTSFADNARTTQSSSSRTQHNTTRTSNHTHSQARTNTNARFSNTSTHSNTNGNVNTNVNNNKWSFDECCSILFDSIERLQNCETKLDQLKVITDLLKHACK